MMATPHPRNQRACPVGAEEQTISSARMVLVEKSLTAILTAIDSSSTCLLFIEIG